MTVVKSGFHPIKDVVNTEYAKYFLVPGVWLNAKTPDPPIKCWGVFTPDKEYLGWFIHFLDAKEQVKIHKISRFVKAK